MDVRTSRLTLALVAGVVVVLLAGIATATWLGPGRRVDAVATSGAVTSATGPSSRTPDSVPAASVPSIGSSAGSTVTSAAASSRSPVSSTASIGPSTNLTVALSAAAARHTHAMDYQTAMQRMFDAINAHDYESWAGAVTVNELHGQDRGSWTRAYSSTTDSNITVLNIAGDQAQVSFVSTQDPALAPATLPSTCIVWNLSYTMTQQAGSWMVGGTVPGSVTMTSCA